MTLPAKGVLSDVNILRDPYRTAISDMRDQIAFNGTAWESTLEYVHPCSTRGSDDKLYDSLQSSLGQDPTTPASSYWADHTNIPADTSVYATIAQLRLSGTSPAKEYATVLGYDTPGDGGGGPLRVWKDGETPGIYADNGSSIIVPTGGDGSAAWVWSGEQPIESIKWLGYLSGGDINIQVTVGATGDYTKINDAIDFLAPIASLNINSKVTADIHLLSGFTMEEQVFLDGFDLSWISITSVDATVPISRIALTKVVPVWYENHTPAFYGENGAFLPIIDTLFYMDTSGTPTLKTGAILKTGSHITFLAGSGITDTGYMAVVLDASHLHANALFTEVGVDFSRCNNRAILALSGSTADFEYGIANDCGWSAFQIINSYGNCRNASLLNSGHYGVRSRDGGNIAAEGANTSGAAEIGFYASFNSKIQANNGIANNCGEYGANASAGSQLSFSSGLANGSGIDGIRALGGSTVYAILAEATGAAGYGLTAIDGSRISARSGEFGGVLGDVHVSGGSLIDARLATYTSTVAGSPPSQTVINDYTGDGCIQNSGTPSNGTLTLEIADAITGGNVSSKTLNGAYKKVGNLVFFSVSAFNIPRDSMIAGNTLYLRGLPFTAFSTVNCPGSIIVENVTFTGYLATQVIANQSYMTVVNSASGLNDTPLTAGALADGTADLTISGYYFL